MKSTVALTAALASVLAPLAAASPLSARDYPSTNPYIGKEVALAADYYDQINGAISIFNSEGKTSLAAKAAEVQKVPVFSWISSRSQVTNIYPLLAAARSKQNTTGKKQLVQLVVYNLPDRDCSAKASDGELKIADAGESRYEAFVKSIFSEIERVPQVQVVIVLEPDSIGNLVTNLNVPKCAGAEQVYKRGIAKAVAILSKLPNVALYIDAAHAGWLGWPGNIGPTADILAGILATAKAENPAADVRGFATNVSNYNGLGNQPQMGYDELVYHQNLAPLLTARGFPAHSLVDQGRSGNQESIRTGSDWCNNKYAGFGPRPTINTPDPIIDAIVWVKPGGQADGTSDPTAVRYDEACGSETSLKPAPEAGSWFQAYFEQLLVNANPSF